jgi:Cdc6-like AAA superfamily ATPase
VVEFPEWTKPEVKKCVTEEIIPSLVRRKGKGMHSTLDLGKLPKEMNVFTLSLYVQALSRISAFAAVTGASAVPAQAALQKIVHELTHHSSLEGASGHAEQRLTIHPYVLHHVCRALSLCIPVLDSPTRKSRAVVLRQRLLAEGRRAVERLLAKHHMGTLNPSESVALAFSAACLALSGDTDDRQHIIASLNVCFEFQDAGGCWALGRVVRPDKDIATNRLEIPTYEIAGVVADILCSLAHRSRESLTSKQGNEAVRRLLQAGRYAERSIVRMDGAQSPTVGWCSDHAYETPLVESWTSAIVLQSMLSLQMVLQESRRQSILRKYKCIRPDDSDWPKWLRWDTFIKKNEMDRRHPVLRYLAEKLIKPLQSEPRGLPALHPRSVSALLFGPPGTSKTTIVKAVADALHWPVVMLSPGNFIEHGLEYIEAQASEVFQDLLELSRAVVIFDECDELFRNRAPLTQTEQTRGITAFVTASMLPKLQELHDRGNVLFFICTNSFDSMDPAVKRGGRIDHVIGVGPPDLGCRKVIIRQVLDELGKDPAWKKPDFLEKALIELARQTGRFTRSEIQRAVRNLARRASWATVNQAKIAACDEAKRLKAGLTISAEEFNHFVKTSKQVSQAITEGVRHAR